MTGSPLLSRRRLGSFSGQSPDQATGSAREENSPGKVLGVDVFTL